MIIIGSDGFFDNAWIESVQEKLDRLIDYMNNKEEDIKESDLELLAFELGQMAF